MHCGTIQAVRNVSEVMAFVELTAVVHGIESISARAILMAPLVFLVVFFVMNFGIRGFAFADLFLAPLIGLAALFLLYATTTHIMPTTSVLELRDLLVTPLLQDTIGGVPYAAGIVFALHVLCLNTLQIVCSEPHWFRMWLLGDKELTRQWPGAGLTGVGWLVMLPVGFSAYLMSGAGQPSRRRADQRRQGPPCRQPASHLAPFGNRQRHQGRSFQPDCRLQIDPRPYFRPRSDRCRPPL
jgi:hypothetical protein